MFIIKYMILFIILKIENNLNYHKLDYDKLSIVILIWWMIIISIMHLRQLRLSENNGKNEDN